MKKHILIAKLFDSGGMNTHFQTLVYYLKAENIVLILEDEQQRHFLQKTGLTDFRAIHVMPGLHGYAHLSYRLTTNIKEMLLITRTMLLIWWLSLINGMADVTVSAAEPEKYLYLLWLPFCQVIYILHSEPMTCMSAFTTHTCNRRLGCKKQIITVSNYMKQVICCVWGVIPTRAAFVVVIHNCISKEAVSSRATERQTSENIRITTMGHVDHRKNPAIWLEVAGLVTRRYPKVDFIWLGNGPLLSKYQQLTIGCDRITFAGKADEIQSCLEQTTIYYQPSLVEPHGIAVVEAMSAGLPCVVSQIGGLPESVEDGVNGRVVKPTDVLAHVDAIELLLKEQLLRSNYGDNSRKRYQFFFSYPQFSKKMDSVYCLS